MQRTVVTLVAVIAILGIAYFGYDLAKRFGTPCETIFQQATTSLETKLDVIKANGSLIVGDQKIQDLTEAAQLTALNLKTCCIVLQGGKLDAEQFLRCKSNAEEFDRKIGAVSTTVQQASAAPAERIAEKRSEVAATIRSAETSAAELQKQVATLPGAPPVVPAPTGAGPASSAATASSEHEPNEAYVDASPIANAVSLDGSISSNDRDFFRFHSPATRRDRAEVKLTNGSMTLAPQIKVYSAKKSQIESAYDSTLGADLTSAFTAEPDQDHYIEVVMWGGSGGDYKLLVALKNAFDAYEPNDDRAHAAPMKVSEAVDANLLDEHDVDWFRLAGAAGADVKLRLESRDPTVFPHVHVYDRDGAEVGNEYSSTAGANFELSFPASSGQDYLIKVEPFSTAGIGAYQLRASQ